VRLQFYAPKRLARRVLSPHADRTPSLRDRHIQIIQEKGQRGWQKEVGYGKRSLVETAMFRYKTLIGPALRARTLTAQKTEARLVRSAHNVPLGRFIDQVTASLFRRLLWSKVSEPIGCRHTPVHEEVAAGNKCRVRTHEECADRCHFVGGSSAFG
jgi:hypothetical protein